MKKEIRLTCPWCKEKAVIKELHDSLLFPIWRCQNCRSWTKNIHTYIGKRIKYLFKNRH